MPTRKFIEKTRSYKVVDDQGREHVIDVYTEVSEVTLMSGQPQLVRGIQSHKMASNGNHVIVNNDCTVEDIVQRRVMRPV
jgi:hypothetical protein